jgi:hypothetical protein
LQYYPKLQLLLQLLQHYHKVPQQQLRIDHYQIHQLDC